MKAFKRRRLVFWVILGILALAAANANAGTYYWDANGSTSGAADTPTGTWGASTFWNSNSTGGSGTSITTSGSADNLNFIAAPAANSGESPYTVTVNGTVYQSGGTATLSGTAIVGNAGTALSLYSINGGVLNANGGLLVGGNNGQGDGTVNIQGSGVLNISGSGGLQIGQDASLATSGSLNLSSGVLSVTGSVTLGSGGGILAGNSGTQLLGGVVIADGTLLMASSGALGGETITSGVAVQNGATLAIQGGLALPPLLPLSLSGVGMSGSGALHVLTSSVGILPASPISGPITLAADSLINIDAGTLSLNGNVNGGFALTVGGSETLALAGSNSFSAALNLLSGTLSVAGVNAAGSLGPLGVGPAPVSLGSNSSPATFLFTGTGGTTNRGFTLAAGGGGMFSVTSSLGLSGAIDGNGSLTKTGSGESTLIPTLGQFSGRITDGSGRVALTIVDGGLLLSGSDTFTGGTMVLEGELTLDSPHALRAGTSLTVGAAAPLEFETASSVDIVPAAATPVPEPGTIVFLLAALVAGTLRVPSAHCGRHFRKASRFIILAVITLRRRLHALPRSFAQWADGKVAGTLRVPSAHCGRHFRKASRFIILAVITLRRRLHALPRSFAQWADGTRSVPATLR